MKYSFQFRFNLRHFRNQFGTAQWSAFSFIQFSKFPDKPYRDRPVVSEATLVGPTDSPLLVGHYDQTDEK